MNVNNSVKLTDDSPPIGNKTMAPDPKFSRLFKDRLSEPLHLNLLSLFVAAFGNFRNKVAFDLIARRHYAYGVLRAAEEARRLRLPAVTVVELGVATGAGLLNLCTLAEKATRLTGVRVEVRGFDRAVGLPAPTDYRDHPELFESGDFPMDFAALNDAPAAVREIDPGRLA